MSNTRPGICKKSAHSRSQELAIAFPFSAVTLPLLHAPSPQTPTSMPIKLASSSKSLLHSVQHDLEQIADHVIVVKVQHEKATLDLQSAVLLCRTTMRLS